MYMYIHTHFLKAKRKLVQELITFKVKHHSSDGPLPSRVTTYNVVKKEGKNDNKTVTMGPDNGLRAVIYYYYFLD